MNEPQIETSDTNDTNEASLYPICERIKPGGSRCGSPALTGKTLCYYHQKLGYALPVGRNMFLQENTNYGPGEYPVYEFPVPILEDAAAVQMAFMQVLHGIANGILKPRQAKLILSALHGARMNLRQLEACLNANARLPKSDFAGKSASGIPPKKGPVSVAGTADSSRPARRASGGARANVGASRQARKALDRNT